jgi:hypothetical protein
VKCYEECLPIRNDHNGQRLTKGLQMADPVRLSRGENLRRGGSRVKWALRELPGALVLIVKLLNDFGVYSLFRRFFHGPTPACKSPLRGA